MAVNLHTHDHKGSVLDAIAKPEDIVQRIKDIGQTSYAITNHGSTSSLLTHYKLAKKAGLKFIFGVEAYICDNINIKEKYDYHHLCIWAENFTGYKNILKLTTVAYDKGFYYKPRIDWNTLMKYKEGLILGSACLGGILGIKDENGKFDRRKMFDIAKKYRSEFKDKFYIELHTNQMAEQIKFNKILLEISSELNIPCIATCDAHYVYKKDANIHRKWVGVDENDENGYYQTDDFYLHTESEMYENLSYLPYEAVKEAVQNTDKIAEMCDVVIPFGEDNFPIYQCENQVEEVKKICRIGWIRKINTKIPKNKQTVYLNRFLEELDILHKANYLNMMLIVWDYIQKGAKAGVRFGCGRGSVGASLVAYLMDITKVDPIENQLTFSRFCNLERVTTADKQYCPSYWKQYDEKFVNMIA